jgi:hypothetical protein
MKKFLNEVNQIESFISRPGSDFLTSYGYGYGYGSGSTSQKVIVPTVPFPQHCPAESEMTHLFATSDHNGGGEDELKALGERLGVEEIVVHVLRGSLQLAVPHQQAVGRQAPRCLRHRQVKMISVSGSDLLNISGSHAKEVTKNNGELFQQISSSIKTLNRYCDEKFKG